MIRFFAYNPVAANLLMWIFIAAGALAFWSIPRQFFPDVTPDKITVTIPYPGVDTEEIEKSVTRRVEDALQKLSDIDTMESFVVAGAGRTILSLKQGVEADVLLQDVKNEIDAILPDLPEGIEEPNIRKFVRKFPILSVLVSGNVSEKKLRKEAIKIRDDLLAHPDISEVNMLGIRDREIKIEVTPEKLQEYRITLAEIGAAIADENLDIAAGELKSKDDYIQVKITGEETLVHRLESKVIHRNQDSGIVFLRDIATISDSFSEDDKEISDSRYRACRLRVMKTENEDMLKIADIVRDYIAHNSRRLAGGMEAKIVIDSTNFLSERLDLMWQNAWLGFILVLLSLWFFLDLRVAFWVALGIPIACLATFMVMKYLSISINLISLMGIILVLGMLVDDAVVVGENIFRKKMEGDAWLTAAVEGVYEVAVPIIAAVATTIAVFLPLLFVAGFFGEWISDIPKVVIVALAMSLLEVFFILPAHLGHTREKVSSSSYLANLEKAKQHFFATTLPGAFAAKLKWLLQWRYVIIACIGGISLAVISLVVSGAVSFVSVQKLDGEVVNIRVEMVPGTSRSHARKIATDIGNLAAQFPEVLDTVVTVGGEQRLNKQEYNSPAIAGIMCDLMAVEQREMNGMRTVHQFMDVLREQIPPLARLKKLEMEVVAGTPPGNDLEIEVRGDSRSTIASAIQDIYQQLVRYQSISSIRDDLDNSQRELRVRLRASGKDLGLTSRDVALPIRHGLFGLEVQTLQDDDDEVTVRLLFPEKSRANLSQLEQIWIKTPQGEVEVGEVAELTLARGDTVIRKVEGERTVIITADVDESLDNLTKLTTELEKKFTDIEQRFPGISIVFAGRKKQMAESFSSLEIGFPIALFLIYAIIAVAFRSYTQPIIIMIVIPFSIIGAILGHFLLGFPFTFMSIIGCVALSGVVVNDNLVLIDCINQLRRQGKGMYEAVVTGAQKRLRAILLTTITTVAGLIPLLSDRTLQAIAIVPMAISLAFGLIFATILTLLMVPALYLIFEDIRFLWRNTESRREKS